MTKQDTLYIDRLRGASILRVVLGHLGLGWIFLPYSSYIGIFLPVLFFCSGYISYHIFLNKEKSIASYLLRRLFSVLLPFYLLYAFALAAQAIWLTNSDNISVEHIARALIVAPKYDEMPFPLGQIWFLRVLLFCILISPIVFIASKRHPWALYIPIGIGTILSGVQSFQPIHREFFFSGHNFFQAIVYGSYFFIGSIIYTVNWREMKISMLALMSSCLIIAISTVYLQGGSAKLSDHAYAPNWFFYFLGIFGIIFVLFFAKPIETLASALPGLDPLLKFCSKHSYGIYLNHSFFIVFFEYTLGLKNVIENWWLALVKIFLVVTFSLFFAIPLTLASSYVIKKTRSLFGIAETEKQQLSNSV